MWKVERYSPPQLKWQREGLSGITTVVFRARRLAALRSTILRHIHDSDLLSLTYPSTKNIVRLMPAGDIVARAPIEAL